MTDLHMYIHTICQLNCTLLENYSQNILIILVKKKKDIKLPIIVQAYG